MGVLNELTNHKVEDILLGCMDRLAGFSEAVRAVYELLRFDDVGDIF
jgi:transposase-like protein